MDENVTEKNSTEFCLSVTACLLIVIALLIHTSGRGADRQPNQAWTAETVPTDWTALRARWQVFHTARTFVALGSFASLILAVLSTKQQK
jgi:hypothetical protein